jgi:hypothetical protein
MTFLLTLHHNVLFFFKSGIFKLFIIIVTIINFSVLALHHDAAIFAFLEYLLRLFIVIFILICAVLRISVLSDSSEFLCHIVLALPVVWITPNTEIPLESVEESEDEFKEYE